MSSQTTDTCSECLMPLDRDQIWDIHEGGEIICLDCMAEVEDTDD